MDEPATRSWSDRLTPLAFVALLLDVISFAFTISSRNGEPAFSMISMSLIVIGLVICRRRRVTPLDGFGFGELLLGAGLLVALPALSSCFATQATH
jgi:hypothetical protein